MHKYSDFIFKYLAWSDIREIVPSSPFMPCVSVCTLSNAHACNVFSAICPFEQRNLTSAWPSKESLILIFFEEWCFNSHNGLNWRPFDDWVNAFLHLSDPLGHLLTHQTGNTQVHSSNPGWSVEWTFDYPVHGTTWKNFKKNILQKIRYFINQNISESITSKK